MENDWKMIEKWTKNANCEQPYYYTIMAFSDDTVQCYK